MPDTFADPVGSARDLRRLRRRRRAVLRGIVEGRLAFATVVELVTSTGLDADQVQDLLADLETAGDVAGWSVPAAELVTLTPLAAARLGVRLIEVGWDESPRWATCDQPDPPPPKARGVLRRDGSVFERLESFDDDPAEIVAESEWQPGDVTASETSAEI